MPVYSSSNQQRLYSQMQANAAALRTIPNTTGTWTNTGAKQLRFDSLEMNMLNPTSTPTYKTGKSSPLIGPAGRKSGAVSLKMPIIPNGAAGTVPDCDHLFQAAMGSTATIVASTSATYNTADTVLPIGLFYYDETAGASSPTHKYATGFVPTTVRFILGGEFPMLEMEGRSVAVAQSTVFASYTGIDAVVKGGLTTYPAEPSPATNGNAIAGFGGTATFDGNVMGELRGTFTIEIATGIEFAEDGFADGYPFAVFRGRRSVKCSNLTFINSDSTNLNNLKTKAFTKAPITVGVALTAGGTGSTITWNLANVQLGDDAFKDNGAAVDVSFNGSMAHASSTSVTDDLNVAFT